MKTAHTESRESEAVEGAASTSFLSRETRPFNVQTHAPPRPAIADQLTHAQRLGSVIQRCSSDEESSDEGLKKKKKKERKKRKKISRKRKFQYKVSDSEELSESEIGKRKKEPRFGKKRRFLEHPSFKKERILRRGSMLAEKPIKGKNIHRVRKKFGGRGVTFMGVSKPPSKETKGTKGLTGHSEKESDRMIKEFEKKYGKGKWHSDSTTREQCVGCRYHYPTEKSKKQRFGYEYPDNEDYMADDEREDVEDREGRFLSLDRRATIRMERDDVPKNKRSKKRPKYKKKIKKEREKTKTRAKSKRTVENKKLAKDLRKLHKTDSDESSHSSDEDVTIVPRGFPKKAKRYMGKRLRGRVYREDEIPSDVLDSSSESSSEESGEDSD